MLCALCGATLPPDGACLYCPPIEIGPVPDPVPAPEMNCPACGGRIREGAVLCRHCHVKFAEPARAGMSLVGAKPDRPARPPRFGVPPILPPTDAPTRGSGVLWLVFGGFTLLAVLCLGGAFYITHSMKDSMEAKHVEECRRTMNMMLFKLQEARRLPRTERLLDGESGQALLEALGGSRSCRLGVYRGSAIPWELIPEEGVVACDAAPGHRSGILVLIKAGRVEFAPSDSPLYRRAMTETVDAGSGWSGGAPPDPFDE